MERVIQVVRSIPALIVTAFLLCLAWPFEILLGIVIFPFKALFSSSEAVRETFHRWPRNTLDTIASLWRWARGDSFRSSFDRPGILYFLENLF